MTEKKPRLSKSRINTFKQCPYRYYVINIEHYKPKYQSPYLIKGTELHEIFDNLEKGDFTLEDRDYPEDYEKHINNVMNFNKWAGKATMHEEKFVDKENNFAGILDRLQTLPNGKTLLLDYKTGKVHPIKDYTFELGAYAHLITLSGNPLPDYIGIFFTEHDTIEFIPCTEELITEAKKEIKAVSDDLKIKLKTGKKCFGKNKSQLCNYCELYKDKICEGLNYSLKKKK